MTVNSASFAHDGAVRPAGGRGPEPGAAWAPSRVRQNAASPTPEPALQGEQRRCVRLHGGREP